MNLDILLDAAKFLETQEENISKNEVCSSQSPPHKNTSPTVSTSPLFTHHHLPLSPPPSNKSRPSPTPPLSSPPFSTIHLPVSPPLSASVSASPPVFPPSSFQTRPPFPPASVQQSPRYTAITVPRPETVLTQQRYNIMTNNSTGGTSIISNNGGNFIGASRYYTTSGVVPTQKVQASNSFECSTLSNNQQPLYVESPNKVVESSNGRHIIIPPGGHQLHQQVVHGGSTVPTQVLTLVNGLEGASGVVSSQQREQQQPVAAMNLPNTNIYIAQPNQVMNPGAQLANHNPNLRQSTTSNYANQAASGSHQYISSDKDPTYQLTPSGPQQVAKSQINLRVEPKHLPDKSSNRVPNVNFIKQHTSVQFTNNAVATKTHGNALVTSTTGDKEEQQNKRRTGTTPSREVHNKLEKNRRAHLKECFDLLRRQIPSMDDKKVSNQNILKAAYKFINSLKKKEREYELEMERLARLKIANQQKVASMKRELSARWEHIDFNSILPDMNTLENHKERDTKSTTTASELHDLEENSSVNHHDRQKKWMYSREPISSSDNVHQQQPMEIGNPADDLLTPASSSFSLVNGGNQERKCMVVRQQPPVVSYVQSSNVMNNAAANVLTYTPEQSPQSVSAHHLSPQTNTIVTYTPQQSPKSPQNFFSSQPRFALNPEQQVAGVVDQPLNLSTVTSQPTSLKSINQQKFTPIYNKVEGSRPSIVIHQNDNNSQVPRVELKVVENEQSLMARTAQPNIKGPLPPSSTQFISVSQPHSLGIVNQHPININHPQSSLGHHVRSVNTSEGISTSTALVPIIQNGTNLHHIPVRIAGSNVFNIIAPEMGFRIVSGTDASGKPVTVSMRQEVTDSEHSMKMVGQAPQTVMTSYVPFNGTNGVSPMIPGMMVTPMVVSPGVSDINTISKRPPNPQSIVSQSAFHQQGLKSPSTVNTVMVPHFNGSAYVVVSSASGFGGKVGNSADGK